ncbi:MAG: tetratricopeptide repeat protein, partial [Nitrospirae bacterium]
MARIPLLLLLGFALACRGGSPDPAALRARAEALARDGKLGAAAVCYRRALAVRPDDPALLKGLARAQVRLHRVPEAIESYRHLLRVAPRDAQAAAELAELYYRGGLYAKALEVADRLLELEPDSAVGHDLRGGSLFALHGPTAEAKAELARAAKLDPEAPQVHVNLA